MSDVAVKPIVRLRPYQIVEMTAHQALSLVNITLRRFPLLRRIYDPAFLNKLVASRHDHRNFLLQRLLSVHDEPTDAFWRRILQDFEYLEKEDALRAFRDKFRKYGRHDMQVAMSELGIAAWVKRRGYGITLEPVTNGKKRCEFSAETLPRTWWEVKTPQEIPEVARDQDICDGVSAGLDGIRQPYILEFDGTRFDIEDLASALKRIRRALKRHYDGGGADEGDFESHGLVVSIAGRTTSRRGYATRILSPEFDFGREYARLIQEKVREASSQLPPDECGIVIIDASMTCFLDFFEMRDACFGELVRLFQGLADLGDARRNDGLLRADKTRRVSAVALYEHCPPSLGRDYRFTVLHNPFALKPCSPRLFSSPDAQQFARLVHDNGRNEIVELSV